jgi:hypothetical protein
MLRTSFACALVSVFALAACGDDGGSSNPIDAGIDSPGAAQTCDNYCATIATNCTGANTMYTSEANCLATCALWQPGVAGEMSNNTRACRIYHAGVAAGNPGLHCRHAGPGGDGTCGTNCEGFCSLVLGACAAEATPPYASMAACMTTCSGFATTPPYDASQTGGNTFACHLYHATAASSLPAVHCPHTTADTGPNQPCR